MGITMQGIGFPHAHCTNLSYLPRLLADSNMHNDSVIHIKHQSKQNGEKNTSLLPKEHTG